MMYVRQRGVRLIGLRLRRVGVEVWVGGGKGGYKGEEY